MRCPKCGYVSFPGLPQCKKCGQPFSQPSPPAGPAHLKPASPILPQAPPPNEEEKPQAPAALAPQVISDSSAPSVHPQPDAWQEELSRRVEGFRRRRARLGAKGADAGTLDLDFDAHGIPQEAQAPSVIDFPVNTQPPPPVDDNHLGEEPPVDFRPSRLEGVPLRFGNSPPEPAEIPLMREPETKPAPILVESSSGTEQAGRALELEGAADSVAGTGDRFLAGVLDALVLLAGVGVFTTIFWRAGGRVSRQPLDIGVIAFVLCAFILLYFGVMSALTSSTPGLIWMGLEIRSQNGQEPGVREAAWRAVGCLISAGAIMLGYIWAVIDTDGLTWHDRISGTFITPRRSSSEVVQRENGQE